MNGYLICEDGPYKGAVITLVDGDEWILGRDPDLSFFVLEDPMVSRKHAEIKRENSLFLLRNLSTINPLFINGKESLDIHVLKEDDTIQIGNNFFRFTFIDPTENKLPREKEPLPEEKVPSLFSHLSFKESDLSRFLIKVIQGPNQGAEFGMNPGESYVLGKDPELADIVFQDMSVSKRHAKLTLSVAGEATIEDLGSLNGTVVGGHVIKEPTPLRSEDLISLGTTLFIIVDKEAIQRTLYSPSQTIFTPVEEAKPEEAKIAEVKLAEEEAKNWKELFIPTKHLIIASTFALFIGIGIISLLMLFRSQKIEVSTRDETKEIKEALVNFPAVQFSFNQGTQKLFLLGHVLTDLEHAELSYLLKGLPFIQAIDDNVIVDEGVWDSINGLLSTNPTWRSILITSCTPGCFVMRGYLATEDQMAELQDFINLNFPYLNLLDNQVIVENTLQTEVQSLLIEKGYLNVAFQFAAGDIIFTGRVNVQEESAFESFLKEKIESIPGIRQVKNFVIFTSESTARIDLTSKYKVMGSSLYGGMIQYVLINNRVLAVGDTLDGMLITQIQDHEILLDKDGLKYKIDYNQQ